MIQKEVRKYNLQPWQEIKGTIKRINICDDSMDILISCEKLVELQIPLKFMASKNIFTKNYVNSFVSILRTDRYYLITELMREQGIGGI